MRHKFLLNRLEIAKRIALKCSVIRQLRNLRVDIQNNSLYIGRIAVRGQGSGALTVSDILISRCGFTTFEFSKFSMGFVE